MPARRAIRNAVLGLALASAVLLAGAWLYGEARYRAASERFATHFGEPDLAKPASETACGAKERCWPEAVGTVR